MYLFYLYDKGAQIASEPFLAENESVLMRIVYTKYKDFPFKKDLKIYCLGWWQSFNHCDGYVPFIDYDRCVKDDEENGRKTPVANCYNVTDIISSMEEYLKNGAVEPDARIVSKEVDN